MPSSGTAAREHMRQIQMMPIDDIKPYPNNPRKNDEAVGKVAESIKQFGFKQPIVVDKDNVIIVGHTRARAAKKLHLKEVPVIVADDLTEEQAKAYRLADNRSAEFSEWDSDLLSEELSALKDMDFDISSIGFEDEDISFPEEDAVDDDFDPEPPEEPISKPGDLWLLGRHRLLCGDSTDPADVQRLMGGQMADLYLTDPPYNVDYTGATKDALKIMNDKFEDEDAFRSFLVNAFLAAKQVMKGGATFYIWHADSEGYNFRGACHDIGWQVRECLIWKKNTMVLGRQDYQWRHEPCLYGWNDGGSHAWYSDRKQTTILDFDKPTASKLHPTMKPIPLFDYLIKNSSKNGDIVLDSFGGSGTTIMACEQDGRTGYSMELDPKYADVIVNRYIAWKNGDTHDVFREEPDGTRTPYDEVKENG